MSRRIGNHRIRPALSNAARAKAQLKHLKFQIRAAVRKGDLSTAASLTSEHAWTLANSLK